MAFLKGVATWASIWTAVVVALTAIQDLRRGIATDPGTLLAAIAGVWLVTATLVAYSRMRRAARRFGNSLGRAVVANPKQDAGAAPENAIQDAIARPRAVRPVAVRPVATRS
jgi:hypothetical protein